MADTSTPSISPVDASEADKAAPAAAKTRARRTSAAAKTKSIGGTTPRYRR